MYVVYCVCVYIYTSFTHISVAQVYIEKCIVCLQGNHSACHSISPCHTAHYSPSKVQLMEPLVIQRLLDTLKGTYVYRNAAEFCRVSGMFLFSIEFHPASSTLSSVVILTGWSLSTTSCLHTSQSEFTSPRPHLL